MRVRGVVGVSALVLAGAVTVASSVGGVFDSPSAESENTAATHTLGAPTTTEAPAAQAALMPTVGLVPAAPRPERQLRTGKPALAPALPDPTALPPGTAAPRSVPVPVIVGPLGIPEIVLNAYRSAELAIAGAQPGCGLSWNLLAGIGKIESGHAGGGQTDAAGTTVTPILGPTLNGHLAGNEVITDTDRGALDGDAAHDRAVGPMQFIPSTWARYASDGNGDGVADPNNVFDAALAAARYLCSGGLDLRDPAQESRAVLRYNNSTSYLANVLAWSTAYRTGGTAAPAVPVVPAPPQRSLDSEVDVEAAAPPSTSPGTPAPPSATAPPETSPTGAAPAPVLAPLPLPTVPGLPQLPCLVFCPPPAQDAAAAPGPTP
ncbi:lytic transglycosylase domain-containing protein [Rhodococcus sp. SGAir0479]|uniref:lytic transglycosylase domain-containing protein n=1 Tax=Rhodococcus sp. SGAir0479 TaxID=2567884 RepID=UPI0010CD5E2B|nr:lytic murein transglycosylase [Rhodococcus sp. SGAir0479]QCQ90319.1 lytic transglycosylase [Rhodococcus sp. SGAir0479]